ncbi:metallophosphoesterase [Paenibacillus sedimenti]|uniref:Metallophosphoesterase n=1 Tax=Paenibacillus sedimenti TaxID=2770274 RepID=A0A926KTB1_9BACL|nr:metallophosphoesterase [Paenibacillus sedimenti]MBD0383107.1 metallophosphoesterase [Paenibacillus sedimenti]
MQPSPPITRREFLKKGIRLAASLIATGGVIGGYSTFLEPRWYDLTRVIIPFERLPSAFHGIRIVHISDIHMGHYFELSDLETVINLIRQEKPDLICFTGDLFDAKITVDPKQISSLLATLEAPLGKWSVLGNHDRLAGNLKIAALLQNGGFRTLFNDHQVIRSGGQAIQIAGVEDMLTGEPDLAKTLYGANAGIFTLLLSHCANFADIAAGYAIDLQLSGHSHGGQIRLPLFGAVVTPPLGNKYVMGLHSVPGSKLQVYTTRGVGTTLFPFRFLCRPEITVLTLEQIKP